MRPSPAAEKPEIGCRPGPASTEELWAVRNGQITATRSGNNLTIAWTPAGGTLQQASALTGKGSDWSDVGTTNPTTVPIGQSGNKFYRVKAP